MGVSSMGLGLEYIWTDLLGTNKLDYQSQVSSLIDHRQVFNIEIPPRHRLILNNANQQLKSAID